FATHINAVHGSTHFLETNRVAVGGTLKGQGCSVSPPHGEHPELRCTKASGTNVSHSLGIRWLAPVRTRTRRWAFAVRETRAAASQITLPKEPDGRYRASVTSVFLRTTGTYGISNSPACVPRSVLVGVRRTWRPRYPQFEQARNQKQ